MKDLVYIAVIVGLVVFSLQMGSFDKLWYARRGEEFLMLRQEVVLRDPKSGDTVGYLARGVWLHAPSIEDVRDTDVGDNQRYKLLIDFENIYPTDVRWSSTTDYFAVKAVRPQVVYPL